MALNLKNPDVERLVDEIVAITGETKTTAVLEALRERRQRLALKGSVTRAERLRRFLEEEVWPQVPDNARKPLSREEEEDLLGYDEAGA